MFQRNSLTVLRVKGVPIRLHLSVLLLIPLLIVALTAQIGLVAGAAGFDASQLAFPGWALGIIGAAGLLVSIVVHELAHTIVAMRHGGKVESIVLMALGGVSQVSQMPARPRYELQMAAAGPATSILIALIFGGAFLLTRSSPTIAIVCFVLAYMNLVLGLFNLAPAFPMDGGRILRAALVGRSGRERATQIAATIGKGMAVLFGLWGVLGGGIWLVFIAVFIWMAAGQERTHAALESALEGVRVGEVTHLAPTIDARASVEEARERLRATGAASALVIEGGRAIGIVRSSEIASIPVYERMRARVRDHMIHVASLERGDELGRTFDRVLREGEVPVVDERGGAVGVIRSTDLLRTLRERGVRVGGPDNGPEPRARDRQP